MLLAVILQIIFISECDSSDMLKFLNILPLYFKKMLIPKYLKK